MKELVKWAWIIVLCILFAGWWIFVIIAAEAVAYLLVLWLKPEWLEKRR